MAFLLKLHQLMYRSLLKHNHTFHLLHLNTLHFNIFIYLFVLLKCL
jgi:hypothetical protein